MTARKAIRELCLYCMNGQDAEIAKCTTISCPLFGYRGSSKGLKAAERPNTSLRAIRAYCLDRCKESVHEVRECEDFKCALHRYRFGKNPDRKPMDEERRAKLAEAATKGRSLWSVKPQPDPYSEMPESKDEKSIDQANGAPEEGHFSREA